MWLCSAPLPANQTWKQQTTEHMGLDFYFIKLGSIYLYWNGQKCQKFQINNVVDAGQIVPKDWESKSEMKNWIYEYKLQK